MITAVANFIVVMILLIIIVVIIVIMPPLAATSLEGTKGGPKECMVLLVIYCGIGVSEGSWEGTCEGNSAACASVRSEKT